MAQKSITRFLHHGAVYRVGFLDLNNTMALSSKKSDSAMVLSPKYQLDKLLKANKYLCD